MSDDLDPTDASTDDPSTGDSGTRRASPSAQAASRARRIGGRPLPGPRPSSEDAEPAKAAPPAPAARVGLAKRRPRPARDGGGRPPRYPDTEAMRRQLERLRWVPAAIAGVLVAVLLGLCVWQSHGVWWAKTSPDSARNDVRTKVLATAKTCIAAIGSYDYRDLDKSEKAGQACITGSFKGDYTKSMDTVVKVIAVQKKAVVVFQTAKAGIQSVSAEGKQWVVLVYGQQQVTNTDTKNQPRLDQANFEVTLDQVGGQWLVSAVR